MGLCTGPKRVFEACADLSEDVVKRQLFARGVDDEKLARLRPGSPRGVEADEVPPRIGGPNREHTHVTRSGFEVLGDTRSQVSIGKERLRVPRRNQVELAVIVELADRVQGLAARG